MPDINSIINNVATVPPVKLVIMNACSSAIYCLFQSASGNAEFGIMSVGLEAGDYSGAESFNPQPGVVDLWSITLTYEPNSGTSEDRITTSVNSERANVTPEDAYRTIVALIEEFDGNRFDGKGKGKIRMVFPVSHDVAIELPAHDSGPRFLDDERIPLALEETRATKLVVVNNWDDGVSINVRIKSVDSHGNNPEECSVSLPSASLGQCFDMKYNFVEQGKTEFQVDVYKHVEVDLTRLGPDFPSELISGDLHWSARLSASYNARYRGTLLMISQPLGNAYLYHGGKQDKAEMKLL